MAYFYGTLSPLPEKCPTCSDEFIEDNSKWHTKDGADKCELTDQVVSEPGFVDKSIGNSINKKLSQSLNDGDWNSGLLSHPFDVNSASISFFNEMTRTPKRPKLSFMESPSIEGQQNSNFKLESNEHPRRDSCSPGYEPSVDTHSRCSFFDYVLRTHKKCIKTFNISKYVFDLIFNDLRSNNFNYWFKEEDGNSARAERSRALTIDYDNSFSVWYNRVCSYIMDKSNVVDYIVDHVVCTSMVATYLACKNKATGIALCMCLFSLYWYRTGRNVLKDNVLTHLLGRLEKLLNDTRHKYCNYFGFVDETNDSTEDGSINKFQVADMYKLLDFKSSKLNPTSLFAFQSGDDPKPGWQKLIHGIEGFYKELVGLKLIPLLLGMTGVVAVSGFCALTDRDYEEISDFEVSDYLDFKGWDLTNSATSNKIISNVWEAIKAIYSDIKTYFDYKYVADKKTTYFEFKKLRNEVTEWASNGRVLHTYIPQGKWATLTVVQQLKWRLDFDKFRQFAEDSLMSKKNFEVLRALYGSSSPRVLQLKSLYLDLYNHYIIILAHKFRPAAYGINIEGGTNVAKTQLVSILQQFILNHHLKLPKESMNALTYFYNGDDSTFWDGASSNQLLCVMDDVDKYVSAIEPEGNKGVKALLQIMNNAPFMLNMASLELKGKVYALYYALVGTSNTITTMNGRSTFDITGTYKHPGAVARRIKDILQVLPHPDFDNGFGCIDAQKLAEYEQENPGKIPDAWLIKLLKTTAANDGYAVANPQYRLEPNPRVLAQYDNDLGLAMRQYHGDVYTFSIVDYLNYLGLALEKHDYIQEAMYKQQHLGHDFLAAGIKETKGVPRSFREFVGMDNDSSQDVGLQLESKEVHINDFGGDVLQWIFWLLAMVCGYNLVWCVYNYMVYLWYFLYDLYESITLFCRIVRRTGGFIRTIRYYRDSSRLRSWVEYNKKAIGAIVVGSMTVVGAVKACSYLAKPNKRELQSGPHISTVPAPHPVDKLPKYAAPSMTPGLRLSKEMNSVTKDVLVSAFSCNKTFIAKLIFRDKAASICNETHGTIISYQKNTPPRIFFNKHALRKYEKKSPDEWCVEIYGVKAQSEEPICWDGNYFLSQLVRMVDGDDRDLVMLDLKAPRGCDYAIRQFPRNDQYLLTRDNFFDKRKELTNILKDVNVTFVSLEEDKFRINRGGFVTATSLGLVIQDQYGPYDFGPNLWVEINEPTAAGVCGNPYFLQRINKPQQEGIFECAFLGIHGAGGKDDKKIKLVVPIWAEDASIPSPILVDTEQPPATPPKFVLSSGPTQHDQYDRRGQFSHYEELVCQYPVQPECIMHLPKIETKNGEIDQHRWSKFVEERAEVTAGTMFRPIGRFNMSTAEWLGKTLGKACPDINDLSAHLYGTCKVIDIEGRTYTVALGNFRSDWHQTPLYCDIDGVQLETASEIISTNKLPPNQHIGVVKVTECLHGEVEYKKLNEAMLSRYDIAMVLSDIASQPAYDDSIARDMLEAADHYLDSVLPYVNFQEHLVKYPIDEGIPINGYVDEDTGARLKSLDALAWTTSPGPPFTYMNQQSGKTEWFIDVAHHSDGRIERAMGDVLSRFVEECRARLLKGHRVVHQIFWKDECSDPISEGFRKPKRPICVGPLYFNLLMREYLLSLNRTMAAFPFVFQQAVGFDSSSQQWAQVYDYVFGTDRDNLVFDGDYRKFDRGLIQEVTDAVRYFILILCIKSQNYDKQDLVMVNSLLKCATSPVVNVFGTIYGFRSVNTSGNPLTTQINCIANNILIWYVLKKKYSSLSYSDAHLLYKNHVRAMTYGDDNIIGCVHHSEYGQVISCVDMQKYLEGIIGYTDAAKSSVVKPHSPHNEVTLLGRYFIEEDGVVLDKFELKRLWRMLLTYRRRKGVTIQSTLRDIYDSALYELARYDEALFNEVRDLLIVGLTNLEMGLRGHLYTRDQIIRAYFWNNHGQELNYSFYRDRLMIHNKCGFMADPRYIECCRSKERFQLQSGECQPMLALPFNHTADDLRCLRLQELSKVPFNSVCDRSAWWFEECTTILILLKLMVTFILFVALKAQFSVVMHYCCRHRPHLIPGHFWGFVLGCLWTMTNHTNFVGAHGR